MSFISPSPSPTTDYDRLKDGAGSGNGSPTFSPSDGRTEPTSAEQAILDAILRREAERPEYKAMEAAFIRWHVTGCFAAAADYHKARLAWELALMDQPTGDAE